jgi:hypothetical protein
MYTYLASIWLSTAPTEPLTHWYQVRCLLQHPLIVKEGQLLAGRYVQRLKYLEPLEKDIAYFYCTLEF